LKELNGACSVHAEYATASVKEDEDRIKQEILDQLGSFREVNRVVEKELVSVINDMLMHRDADATDVQTALPTLLTSSSTGQDHVKSSQAAEPPTVLHEDDDMPV